jgi:protein phosphatase
MRIEVSARSIYELGQRANQEDFIYPSGTGLQLTSDLYILCDGMGGHEKGEVASETVCRTMSAYIKSHPREDGLFDETDFQKALDAAYDALDAEDTSAEKKMGTTLTLVKYHAGGCFIAHIGDSRIYHIRPATRTVLYVTRDHSLVNDLVQLGELTPEQARHSKQKNIITRAMQPHQNRRDPADCCNLTDLQPGDFIYMCSDGMLEISRDADIVEILSKDAPDSEKIEVLRNLTRDNRDNHSAFLIRIVSVDPSGKEEIPASKPKSETKPESQPTGKSQLAYWIVGIVILAAVAAIWWLNHK